LNYFIIVFSNSRCLLEANTKICNKYKEIQKRIKITVRKVTVNENYKTSKAIPATELGGP
jgi:hypothetical protein